MKTISHILLVTTLIVLAACGGGDGGDTSTPPAAVTPAATAVGTPIGSAATATLGAAGGTLSSPDGKVALRVPAGALAADTVIRIQPITNHAHGGKGNAYRFTPDGQTFQTPITLRFTYTDADLEGTVAQALGAAYQSEDRYWHWARNPVLDAASKTVTVSTTHFTDVAAVAGFNLRPASATVKVGGTVALKVKFCYPAAMLDIEAVPLAVGLECFDPRAPDALAPANGVSQWAVSGPGSVSGGSFSATYTAPATKPRPNTAFVSARINNTKFGTLYLRSNITVIDTVTAYTGDLAFNGSVASGGARADWTGTARVTFVRSSVEPGGAIFTVDPATASITFDSYSSTSSTQTCTLVGTAVGPAAAGVPFVGKLTVVTGPPSKYSFSAVGTASGTVRCVSLPDGKVTSQPIIVGTGNVGTMNALDPGWQPLTDELQLKGSAAYTFDDQGDILTVNSTWSLYAQ